MCTYTEANQKYFLAVGEEGGVLRFEVLTAELMNQVAWAYQYFIFRVEVIQGT